MTETLNTFANIVRQLNPQTGEHLSGDIARVTNALSAPATDVMRQCGDDVWGECKQFPKGGWRYEVGNNDTVLGYWDWVVHQAEADEVPLKSLGAPNIAKRRETFQCHRSRKLRSPRQMARISRGIAPARSRPSRSRPRTIWRSLGKVQRYKN